MKRLWSFALAVLLGFCFPAAVRAAQSSLSHTGEVSEAGITLNFPSEVALVTRSGLEDDSIRKKIWDYGFNPILFEQFMEEGNYYIYAYSSEYDFILTVSMQTDADSEQIGDWGRFSDQIRRIFMEQMKGDFETILEESGIDPRDGYITWREDCPQALFLEMGCNGAKIRRIYQTVFNGKWVALGITPLYGTKPLDTELCESIFQSLRFDEETPTRPYPWRYTDPVTGANLTVPARWAEGEPWIDGSARFVSEDRQKKEVIFYTQDVKTKLDNSGASRSYMDLDAISPATVAEIVGVSESELDQTEYAGLPFYHYARQVELKFYDIPYTQSYDFYIHIRDGYLYAFITDFAADDPAFSDFTDLISSMEYPLVQESLSQRIHTLVQRPMLLLIDNAARTAIYTAAFLYLLSLVTLPLVLFRFPIRKRAVKAATGLLTSIVCGALLFVLLHFLFSAFPQLPYGTTLAGVAALAWGTGMYFLLHKGYRPPEGEEEPPAITADSFAHAGEQEENPASAGAAQDSLES